MCRISLYYLVQWIEKIVNNINNEQLEKHNRHTHITQQIIKEFTQKYWAMYLGLAFSGDLSIMSSRAEFLQMWAQIESQHNRNKQQGFTWIPQVFLSTQTLPFTLCLYFLSVSALLAPVSIIHWLLSQFALVYSFSLSGSLAPSLCPLKLPRSIKQPLLNVFRDGGHLFCNRRDHWHVKILKQSFLYLHKELHRNIEKFA